MATLKFLIHFQAFRDPLRGEFMHFQIFMVDGPNPLTWVATLLCYSFNRNPTGDFPRLALEFGQFSPGLSLFRVVSDETHTMEHISLMSPNKTVLLKTLTHGWHITFREIASIIRTNENTGCKILKFRPIASLPKFT
jgi:hypothetical protein